ncbi:MAG: hypothetical protein LIR25_02625, partial [bacterium]|nr:hypothetical protein [bacterium]
MDKIIQDKFKLQPETIDNVTEETRGNLAAVGIDSKDALRLTLFLEESMLKYRDAFSEDAEASVRMSRFFGAIRVSLRVRGDSLDPFAADESDVSVMGSLMANTKTLDMAWRYRGGANYVTFTIQKKR